MTSECRTLVTGLNHPECVAIGSDGTLFTGGEAGEIYRITPDGAEVTVLANTRGESGGIALDADGNLYECNLSGHLNRITPQGEVSVYSTGTDDLPTYFPNYPVFDPAGNLFFSDSGDWHKLNGRVYVVGRDGTTRVAIPDYLAFPNGLALDAAGGWLYIVQSSVRNVVRVEVAGGEVIGRPEIYVEFAQQTVPDGVALAENGNLYVACYEPNVIYVVERSRRVDVLVEGLAFERLNRPTNVTFSRETTEVFYPNYGAGEIVVLEVGERGLPLCYPSIQRS
jgi:gluconolactonase